jgi:Fe-S-cluster containining protein
MTYDCLSCGACCYGPEEYVSVSGPDHDRMDKRTSSRYVIKRGDRKFLKMVNGHCAALHARQGHFSCRMYKMRPTPCHVVEAGSRECLVARKRRGIPSAEGADQ